MVSWHSRKPASDVPPEIEEVRKDNEFDCADRLDNGPAMDAGATQHMERALEELRARHLAFRRPERTDVAALEELRLEILSEVAKDKELDSYYREAWGLPVTPESSDPSRSTDLAPHRRIVAMQIELMARAFSVLQLQLFANAPENRGWMTLFRRWGNSPRFKTVFRQLAIAYAPEFRKFYELYIEDARIPGTASGDLPIHHPWLAPKGARGRGLYMDCGRVEPEVEVRPGAEGVGGAKGTDGVRTAPEQPSDSGTGGDPPGHPPNT
jgi:hypothetical protein